MIVLYNEQSEVRPHPAADTKLSVWGDSESTDIAHWQTVNRKESLQREMNISRPEAKTKELN